MIVLLVDFTLRMASNKWKPSMHYKYAYAYPLSHNVDMWKLLVISVVINKVSRYIASFSNCWSSSECYIVQFDWFMFSFNVTEFHKLVYWLESKENVGIAFRAKNLVWIYNLRYYFSWERIHSILKNLRHRKRWVWKIM